MRIIGQEGIAEAFAVAPKTIVVWQEDGFPIAQRGGPGVASEYELPACIQWLVDREVRKVQGGESPRDRVFRLQGDALELEMSEKRGALIPAAEIEPKLLAAVIAAREGLLRERRRLAALLDGVNDRRRREEIIGQVHEAFLRRLSMWRQAGDELEAEPDLEPEPEDQP